MKTLIRHRVLIWVCAVCLCPKNGTLGLYGLNLNGFKTESVKLILNIQFMFEQVRSVKTCLDLIFYAFY